MGGIRVNFLHVGNDFQSRQLQISNKQTNASRYMYFNSSLKSRLHNSFESTHFDWININMKPYLYSMPWFSIKTQYQLFARYVIFDDFFVICWLFFKINFSKKFFKELYQRVKLFESWSGSKLFAKVINRRHKSLVATEEFIVTEFKDLATKCKQPTELAGYMSQCTPDNRSNYLDPTVVQLD